MGTLRIISLSRGLRKIAPLLGFFEILIWLMAIRQIFNHMNNPACFVAYAGGFSMGIFVGMSIEHKLALGLRVVRVITRLDATELIEDLRKKGFGVTVVPAEGNVGPVKVIFMVIKRASVPEVTAQVRRFNPKAFYSVEDVRGASEGIFPNHATRFSRLLSLERKGK
jgi:uncharacterized protein YebE (UPF0316 family)